MGCMQSRATQMDTRLAIKQKARPSYESVRSTTGQVALIPRTAWMQRALHCAKFTNARTGLAWHIISGSTPPGLGRLATTKVAHE